MTDGNAISFFIVDDDLDLIEFMTVVLEDAGHKVKSSVDGVPALSAINAMRPDCVLTDLVMADLDGLALCDEIRANKDLSATKIIVVSARAPEYWRDKAAAHGAQGYIAKPLDPETFAREVESLLAG